MSEVKETVDKMTKALVESQGHAYATGYLSQYLTQIIEKHVTDPAQLELLKINMLSDGILALLDSRKKG